MRTHRSTILALTAAILLAGCGGDDAPGTATSDPSTDDASAADGSGETEAEEPVDDEGTSDDTGQDEPTGDGSAPADGDDAGGADPDDGAAEDGATGDGATQDATPDVPDLHPEIDDLDEIVVTISTGDTDVRVDAKLAADTADRQRGLMEVTDLPGGVGMLFLFEEEREGGFWMKDTLVPLDIAYSSEDGEILEILTMEPCEADPCPSYDPEVAYLTALEVPAGWFDEVGVSTGDELTWSEPVAASGG